MWTYIKKYIHFAAIAALFMVGEVLMDLLQPGLMSRIVDDGVLGVKQQGVGDLHLILELGLAMIGFALLGGLFGSLNNMFVHLASQNVGNEMRKDCFRNIMGFSFQQMDHFGTGSLVTRLTNDITQVQVFVAQFVRGMIRTVMLMAGSIFFMFRLNRQFGYIVLGAFPVILGCMGVCLGKAGPVLPRLQQKIDQINGIMQEDVSGIRIIKACTRELYEKLRFGKANEELVHTQLKVLVIFVFMNPAMNALIYGVITLILTSGFDQVKAGQTTPGVIMAAITYTTQLLNGILMLVMLFQNISKGAASWVRIREVLNSSSEMEDGTFDGESAERGRIEFRNVSFAFPETGQTILRDVNLVIHPGETVAVMGATGCGKTALVSLIPRFYDVTSGELLVDGVDVRAYRQKQLRDKIAMTLQKSELFGTSIRENISWGRPGASEEEICASAAIAQADGFIQRTQNGYDTVIAERGMSLSGGQKQRLSIARAVLKPAEILIFDDAASALDLKTEFELYEALRRERGTCTKIMVVQRIASARYADRIIVLQDGRIEASGTHEELMKSCRAYQDIYESQMGEESHG